MALPRTIGNEGTDRRCRTDDLSCAHVDRYSYSSGQEEVSEPAGLREANSSGAPSPDAPCIEHGNRLLAFQRQPCEFVTQDYQLQHAPVAISAQLSGMFILSESSRSSAGDLPVHSSELTCYRRNLFQISGSVNISRKMQYAVNERGDRFPIVSQELAISASESVEGNPAKIISVPWKTPASAAPPKPKDKSEKEPTSIPLDQPTSHDMSMEYSVFPIAWKRLQFRNATANNGRRKELQQYYTIKLNVIATLSTGAKVSIGESISAPIIVRGRSPRNFQKHRDVPLSTSGGSMRKAIRSSTRSWTSATEQQLTPRTAEFAYQPSPLDSHQPVPIWPDGTYCSNSLHPGSTATRSSVSEPDSPYSQSSPDLARIYEQQLKRKSSHPALFAASTLEIPGHAHNPLRRTTPDEERPRKQPRSQTSPMLTETAYFSSATTPSPVRAPSWDFPRGTISGPHVVPNPLQKPDSLESTDLFYDFLPMGLDEWPLHPMYRPHIA